MNAHHEAVGREAFEKQNSNPMNDIRTATQELARCITERVKAEAALSEAISAEVEARERLRIVRDGEKSLAQSVGK